MPRTIQAALKQPPICEVTKISGRGPVVRYVEFELIKATALVSVGGNMNDTQVQFVATQLVEMFPNESLADFKLCFERGCIGQYGEIYRLDGIVLRGWMEKYLDEKYQALEDELMKEKDRMYGKPEKKDEPIDGPGYQEFKSWAAQLQEQAKARPITDADIRREGQEQPMRKQSVTSGYKYFDVRGVRILAITQEHAEELAEKMLKDGTLEEYES